MSAQASYYVRPYIQIGGGGTIDGYSADGPTRASQHFMTDYEATVDLADGTVKSYLNVQGPDSFAAVSGTFGDRITFSPNAADTTVDVRFDFDGWISADEPLLNGASLPFISVYATLYVYKSGSGVNYSNFGNPAYADSEVVSKTTVITFRPDSDFYETINDGLFGSFTVGLGSYDYDIFTGLSISAATQENPINIEMNFLNTGTFGIQTEPGVTFTSDSGVLLKGNPPGTVPEPATWVMMLMGFGLICTSIRRRDSRLVAVAA